MPLSGWQESPGACVIDLGSGQGWHARRLASGFDVVAVEREPRLAAESMRRSFPTRAGTPRRRRVDR
jgi:protein-L-isoaspartate O-methyltransferase